MKQAKEIEIDSYYYNLPDHKIAKYPLAERDSSKLLIYNKAKIHSENFTNLYLYLPENSLLCFNNTKVVYSRLFFQKKSGAKIEVFCLEPILPKSYDEIFASTSQCKWKCMVGNLKKWKSDNLVKQIEINGCKFDLLAEIESRDAQDIVVKFSWNSSKSFGEILESEGNIPIPPYLNRASEAIDKQRYQTLYANIKGSVAAPTAGLHFSTPVFDSLIAKNIKIEPITLHVSAGTFQPVKTGTIGEHKMHKEYFSVSAKAIEQIKLNIGNITATGTTTMRTIESLYFIAENISKGIFDFNITQWEAYADHTRLNPAQALDTILEYMTKNSLSVLNASTEIIIVPGFRFNYISRLITNFHQPRSTLLLLVAAFIGDDWENVYHYALNNNFRFLSYGDSSLLIP
jgi:S-adenosylmethionine:tRNA ribosyltransferase-isomerase